MLDAAVDGSADSSQNQERQMRSQPNVTSSDFLDYAAFERILQDLDAAARVCVPNS